MQLFLKDLFVKRLLIFFYNQLNMPYQDYKILSFIGKGGYGEVYKVQHVSTGDVYAMKTVSNSISLHRI